MRSVFVPIDWKWKDVCPHCHLSTVKRTGCNSIEFSTQESVVQLSSSLRDTTTDGDDDVSYQKVLRTDPEARGYAWSYSKYFLTTVTTTTSSTTTTTSTLSVTVATRTYTIIFCTPSTYSLLSCWHLPDPIPSLAASYRLICCSSPGWCDEYKWFFPFLFPCSNWTAWTNLFLSDLSIRIVC